MEHAAELIVKRWPSGQILEERWVINGQLHRVGGPAYTCYAEDGTKVHELWVRHGRIDRTDGPAIIHYNENGNANFEDWWIGGEHTPHHMWLERVRKDPRVGVESERLRREWTQHQGIIIAVDFDDTCMPYRLFDHESVLRCFRVLRALRRAKALGARLVVWTASDPARHKFIREYLQEQGIEIEEINKNLPGLRYGNHGKIYANLYLDDRAGLDESLARLEDLLDWVESGGSTP